MPQDIWQYGSIKYTIRDLMYIVGNREASTTNNILLKLMQVKLKKD